MKRMTLMLLGFVVLAGTSLQAQEESAQAPSADTTPSAWVKIAGTAQGSTVSGGASFYEIQEGLRVVVELSGVAAGKHGLHIHQYGSCEDAGNAAGGHFNPHGVDHGFLPENGLEKAHAGDMGNIEINEEGNGSLEIVLKGVSLTGENGVYGKAVILHEKEDDFGQPTGNAGGRIGCGIIVSSDDTDLSVVVQENIPVEGEAESPVVESEYDHSGHEHGSAEDGQ